MKASTLSDIKIIDPAYTLDKVSPQGVPIVFWFAFWGVHRSTWSILGPTTFHQYRLRVN